MKKIIKPIQRELELFEKEFVAILKTDICLINQVIKHIVDHKGKRLRPILVLLSSHLRGEPSTRSLKAATIVELLHTAALIHDDVVDSSKLRRGVASVHSLWQNKTAVLIGDFIFSQAFNSMLALHSIEAIEILSSTIKRMTQGELLQIEGNQECEIDEKAYFRLIADKTASLFSAACELGIVTSQSNNRRDRILLKDFGENLGMAYQIKDDLLDYIGNEGSVGKPIGNDIRNGKITLPLIYSFQQAPEKESRKIKQILREKAEESIIAEVTDFIKKHDGIRYAEEKAKSYAQQALKSLEIFADSSYKRSLIAVIDFILDREH